MIENGVNKPNTFSFIYFIFFDRHLWSVAYDRFPP